MACNRLFFLAGLAVAIQAQNAPVRRSKERGFNAGALSPAQPLPIQRDAEADEAMPQASEASTKEIYSMLVTDGMVVDDEIPQPHDKARHNENTFTSNEKVDLNPMHSIFSRLREGSMIEKVAAGALSGSWWQTCWSSIVNFVTAPYHYFFPASETPASPTEPPTSAPTAAPTISYEDCVQYHMQRIPLEKEKKEWKCRNSKATCACVTVHETIYSPIHTKCCGNSGDPDMTCDASAHQCYQKAACDNATFPNNIPEKALAQLYLGGTGAFATCMGTFVSPNAASPNKGVIDLGINQRGKSGCEAWKSTASFATQLRSCCSKDGAPNSGSQTCLEVAKLWDYIGTCVKDKLKCT